jgi:heme a synthase
MASTRSLQIWLGLCATLVFFMVVIGGLTRLSESGLSIVEWKVVSGILPPLTTQSWEKEFLAYQTSPQFKKVNQDMTLEDFKGIFWLEYIHRLLGRTVGMCYLLPLLYYAIRKAAPTALLWRMAGIGMLVGAQGVVGWYMVKSGLIDNPAVSQYRLAFHLCLAIVIFALTLWQWLRLRAPQQPALPTNTAQRLSIALISAVFLQIFMGALVAGLDAGLTYNTFPLMDGQWIPDGLYMQSPALINHFENIITVQFQHRVVAFIVLAIAITLRLHYRKKPSEFARERCFSTATLHIILLQIIFGISTLIMVVPIPLATAHQAIAVLVIASCLFLWHEQRYPCTAEIKNP